MLDQLGAEYDALLLTCGEVDPAQVQQWGLAAAKRGIQIDRNTFQTDRIGVFAAGNAIRGKGLVVRSVADGKEVAAAIGQYLAGKPILGPAKPFSSRMGAVDESEVSELVQLSGSADRQTPCADSEYCAQDAASQSNRCLVCGCPSQGKCKLERYATIYRANPTHYGSERRAYELVGRHSSVLFEPGKCIKCELCVKIAAAAKEPLGLTFVGRGFDVRLDVPFRHEMDEAMSKVAAQCIEACPTGALMFAKDRVAPG
jgi:ferredoxin